jgi:hypothetical protein
MAKLMDDGPTGSYSEPQGACGKSGILLGGIRPSAFSDLQNFSSPRWEKGIHGTGIKPTRITLRFDALPIKSNPRAVPLAGGSPRVFFYFLGFGICS